MKEGTDSALEAEADGGDVVLALVMEEERGIEVVVDGDVDLAGAEAIGVDDEGGGGSVALGEVMVEEVDPVVLGRTGFVG